MRLVGQLIVESREPNDQHCFTVEMPDPSFNRKRLLKFLVIDLPLGLSTSLALVLIPRPTWAAPPIPSTPGAADIGRVEQRAAPQESAQNAQVPAAPNSGKLEYESPPGSEKIYLVLKKVLVTGSSVYSTPALTDFAKDYVGKRISLAIIWRIAAKITSKYHEDGYFLTTTVVPQQEIRDGVVQIHIIEGRIGKVELDGKIRKNAVIHSWISKLISYRPLRISQLEHVLLELDNIAGVNFRTVLRPGDEHEPTGDVILVLENRPDKRISSTVEIDDYGSRYFGAIEGRSTIQIDELPGFRATATLLSSLSGSPANSLLFGYIQQDISILPAASLQIYSSYAKSNPQHDLKALDEHSDSISAGTAVEYDLIKQRATLLVLRTGFEAHNISTNVFKNIAQTRDRVRVLIESMNYQHFGVAGDQTTLDLSLTRGLDVLDASNAQDPSSPNNHLSRADAKPNFTKINADYTYLKSISKSWSVFIDGAMQLTADPLYSLEQFGYGGQTFGRAYSDSEILGDRGVAGDIEFRHLTVLPSHKTVLTEYAFLDAGVVWNNREFIADAHSQSGESMGFGVRALLPYGIASNIGLAFPIGRRQVPPLYGNGKNPRPIFSLTKSF